MTLRLSSQRIKRMTTLQRTLVSPLEHENMESWCKQVLHKAEELFEADRSAVWLPWDGGMFRSSENIDREYLDEFGSRVRGIEPGAIRYSDEIVDAGHQRRRQHHLPVWNMDMLARLARRRPEESETFHAAVVPAGIAHSVVLSPALGVGEALLGIGHSNPDKDPYGEEAGLDLARLLLPSFEAGLAVVVREEIRRETLTRVVDELAEALAVFDTGGCELHRSARLRMVLAGDAQSALLVKQMGLLAKRTLRLRRAAGDDAAPVGSENVSTVTARYALRSSLVGPAVIGPKDAVLVAVERLTPRLPKLRTLSERYSLTHRQAEIALLLARGLTNRDIAKSLRISHHTVRHHAEWVFDKVDVHSRAELVHKLLLAR